MSENRSSDWPRFDGPALDSQYAWTVSEIAAREDGLDPALIDVVRHRRLAAGLGEREVALVTFARELFDARHVSATTYARTVDVFGERDLVDLVVVMGERAGDIALLTAFDQHLPPGRRPCFRYGDAGDTPSFY